MSHFRKHPVVIEARQYTETSDSVERDLLAWINAGATAMHRKARRSNDGIIIPTLEGNMLAIPGDWIIRGVQGEHYICKPEIFAATYEPVGE